MHKLAFFGVGGLDSFDQPAPPELNNEVINACQASMHKFDQEGNLPLHLAAASGNIDMVLRLCKLFPSGASVKNNKGHLPIHMALLACSDDKITSMYNVVDDFITVILDLFPGGLAITDNDGNLPIHLAVCHLTGFIGAKVVKLLLNKAKELGDELRFPSGVHQLHFTDDNYSDIDVEIGNQETSVLLSRNSMNWTPLMAAVKNNAGWQVLDALLNSDDIEKIILDTDESGNNVLQLTLEEECYDPPSTLSLLKFFPNLVRITSIDGALPIETACIRDLQQEVIMAIALLDLPIDLDSTDNQNVMNRKGCGGSWWYLNCECDDAHIDIVNAILDLCDYQQKRALCFAKNAKGRTLLRRATPKCKEVLRKALRFVGRYEFVGNSAAKSDDGPKIFEALDFGDEKDPIDEGQKVLLHYYGNEINFSEDVSP